MELIFTPMRPFVSHPERIALVAVVAFMATAWLSFAVRRVVWPPMIAGAAWTLFASWEWYCKQQTYNIRVDVLVIAPVLLCLTAWGVISPLLVLTQLRQRFRP